VEGLAGLLPIVLLGVVFWALLIRPQQRVKRAQQELQRALSPGDEVVTIGGMHGRVHECDDATVDVEVAEEIVVRFDRRAIARITRDVPGDDDDAVDEDDSAVAVDDDDSIAEPDAAR
jgi:preprotein translocase subunit YajC